MKEVGVSDFQKLDWHLQDISEIKTLLTAILENQKILVRLLEEIRGKYVMKKYLKQL